MGRSSPRRGTGRRRCGGELMIRKPTIYVLTIGALVVIIMIAADHFGRHRLDVKSCFDDVRGLRSGAVVRLSGVDIGTVRSVRAQPQNKNCPAEAQMTLKTPYRLSVPQDAMTAVETAGVLGETYVNIDVRSASGPPIEDYGYLKSKQRVPEPSLGDIIKAVGDAATVVKAASQPATTVPGQPVQRPRQ
jgi:phospholipid/cholesterol/gamma-HCH transport system substrate-binding protein